MNRPFFKGVLLGAPWVFSFAPCSQWWVGFVLLFVLGQQAQQKLPLHAFRAHFLLGLGFGLSAFACGVCWLYISLHDYGGLPAVLAIASVLLFSLYLALFSGFATALYGLFYEKTAVKRSNILSSVALDSVVWAALWSFFEWVRGTLFTGFAWLSLGDSLVDSPFSVLLPWLGSYGALFVVLFTTFALFLMMLKKRWGSGLGFVAFLVLLFAVRWVPVLTIAAPVVHLVGVQTNVDQSVKFDPSLIISNMTGVLQMAEGALGSMPKKAVMIFPETVNPIIWSDTPKEWLLRFRDLAKGPDHSVLLGAAIYDHSKFYNSIIQLNGDEEGRFLLSPPLRHDKRHLVPFGEFIPWGFHWFVQLLNIPMGDFGRGQDLLVPFQLGNNSAFAATVCYEDTFSGEFAQLLARATTEPTVLLNLSNLAWFGQSWALDQHAQMGRVRSAEHKKPSVRVTNTGLSGVVDEYGQWVQQVKPSQAVVWRADVVGQKGLTFFAKYGSAIWYFLWIVALMLVCVRVRASGAYNSSIPNNTNPS